MSLALRHHGSSRLGRGSIGAEWWSVVIAAVVAFLVGLALPHEPDRVSVTIVNPTDHLLYISTSTPDDDTLSFVTIVGPHSTATASEVLDRGQEWVLRLGAQGAIARRVTVSREDLMDGSFAIPTSINEDLAVAGVLVDRTIPDADE